MTRLFYWLLLGCLPVVAYSQGSLHLNAGWNVSNTIARQGGNWMARPQPIRFWDQFGQHPYVNIQYAYQHQRWSITTGLIWMQMGSNWIDPLSSFVDYKRHYYLIPVLAGYHWALSEDSRLVFQGGIEAGLQNSPNAPFPNQLGIQANITFGTTITWKALQWGTRLHFGTMDVSNQPTLAFHHYGLTVFMGVRLWDEARSTERRLNKAGQRAIKPEVLQPKT